MKYCYFLIDTSLCREKPTYILLYKGHFKKTFSSTHFATYYSMSSTFYYYDFLVPQFFLDSF